MFLKTSELFAMFCQILLDLAQILCQKSEVEKMRMKIENCMIILPEFCQNSPKLASIQNPDAFGRIRDYPEVSGTHPELV